MALFDQLGNIVDLFTQNGQSQQESEVLANRAGVDLGDWGKIVALGLPAILQGMNRNNQTQAGLDSFTEALTQHEQDIDQYQNPGELAKRVDEQDGDKILGHVFNDKQSIIDRIADTLNLEPVAVKRALVLLAPMVIKTIADRRRSQNLDAEGVQRQTDQYARQAQEAT